MNYLSRLFIIAVLMVGVFSCGPKVMVPPEIDLKQHEVIGIIEFRCSTKGKLAPYTTMKFTEAIRQDQKMVRIVDLGSEPKVLKAVYHDQMDQAAFKAIGEKYDVRTVFTGVLVVSDIKPDITITPGFDFISLEAEVDAMLVVQMIETATGASLWSSSASATEQVGHVSVFGGEHFAFDAKDPDKAYGKLIDALVKQTTKDFRATWKRK